VSIIDTPEQPEAGIHPAQVAAKGSSGPIAIEEGVICRGVYGGRPLVAGDTFEVSAAQLCCFTKISGIHFPAEMTHVWYFDGTEKARINLTVKPSTYYTYSSKRIEPHEVGDWRVDVLGPNGTLLKTLEFKVSP
jgi:hypothetical protein